MTAVTRRTASVDVPDASRVDWDALLRAQVPTILRGLARDWPIVAAGLRGPTDAMRLLEHHDAGRPIVRFSGKPEIGGRFFYDAAMTGMNFTGTRALLPAVLADIAAELGEAAGVSHYVGSTDVGTYFPGFRDANDLRLDDPMFVANPPLVSLWIGNRTTAATHYDYSNNIACCLVGHRRFTLFPPDQIGNLYPGPLEPTPGGQVVSMADPNAPDFQRFPRFRDALAAAEIAELAPGDALFYPAMWWHQVEALDAFNVMMNYWWNTSPGFIDSPMTTLLHAMLSLRDRPEAEKAAWRAVFDYYVFGPGDAACAHLPEHAQGALARIDDRSARRLRATLIDRLNR